MSEKIRIAVVGTGAIAQVIHIPQWKRMEQVELIAVCDVVKAKAAWIAEKYRVPHTFGDIDEVLKLEELDAVDICTPTASHTSLAIAALSARKHVLVEKPMARNYEESRAMVAAAREYNRKLMVGMNVRFRQDARILHRSLRGGELGEIFYAKTGWLRRREKMVGRNWFVHKDISGGGVMMDLGVQMLDLGLWLMGNPDAASVQASTYNKVTGFDVEDSVAALLRLNNGATLGVEASWTLFAERDSFYTTLFGTHGGALLQPLRIHKEVQGRIVNVTPTKTIQPGNLYKRSYQDELHHFVEALTSGSRLSSSGEEILERMRIVDAIYESAQSGREVKLA